MRFKTQSLLILSLILNSCSDYTKDTIVENSPATPPPAIGSGGSSNTKTRPIPEQFQNPNSGEFSAEKMLVNIGLNVISKNVDDFYLKAGLLKSSIENYCNALSHLDDFNESEEQAKNQWKQTMLSFHKLSMAPVGPLSDNDGALSKSLYSWPVISACGIDKEVIKNRPSSVDIDDTILLNQKSLSAIEYLLFEDTLTSKCSQFQEPQAKSWSEKNILEKKKNRCDYALRLSRDIQQKAIALREQWNPELQNYTAVLVDGSKFETTDKAVNGVSDALFAFEIFRDISLAIPLGIHKDCIDPSGKCIDRREHIWSGLTAEAMVAKIKGFQEAFFGSSYKDEYALGFDDYLATKGFKSLSDEIWMNLEDAQQKMNPLLNSDPSLAQTLLNTPKENCDIFNTPIDDLAPLCRIYKDIQNATTKLKVDMLIILSLQAPATHAGDND